jgi:hypothetical protein
MADLSVCLGTLTVLGLWCAMIRVSPAIPENYTFYLTITITFPRSRKGIFKYRWPSAL